MNKYSANTFYMIRSLIINDKNDDNNVGGDEDS